MGKVLVDKGNKIGIEKPGYLGAIQAFSLFEPAFVPITLESDGINTEELEDVLIKNSLKLLYTVPNFQNPTGITYSKEKREAVYELLQDKQTILIEDDPYGELRFDGDDLPYIGANRLESSVVFGTFSKTITPGMRLGFLCTKNEELKKHIITAKQASDLHTNIFAQYVIYDYLMHNDYDCHIERIKSLYQKQSTAMVNAMERYFPKHITYTKPQGGMFMWAELKKEQSALSFIKEAMEQKVIYVPGDSFYCDCTNVNTLRLNYTNSDTLTIEDGIKRLGSIFA
jgi:2-aminoadipate transaminase